jgi:hypothetical protein
MSGQSSTDEVGAEQERLYHQGRRNGAGEGYIVDIPGFIERPSVDQV